METLVRSMSGNVALDCGSKAKMVTFTQKQSVKWLMDYLTILSYLRQEFGLDDFRYPGEVNNEAGEVTTRAGIDVLLTAMKEAVFPLRLTRPRRVVQAVLQAHRLSQQATGRVHEPVHLAPQKVLEAPQGT